jgi:hypothetical protein
MLAVACASLLHLLEEEEACVLAEMVGVCEAQEAAASTYPVASLKDCCHCEEECRFWSQRTDRNHRNF